jgi:hypothetical protein
MIASPIHLLQLLFKRVHVEIDEAHAPAEPLNPMTTVFVFHGVSLTTEITLSEVDMNNVQGPMYAVTLRLLVNNQASADEPERKFSPYQIDIEANGLILLPKGAERFGPPRDLVTINGAGLLWSAIREQLLNLTSRMAAGPVMLPTVHFQDLKEAVPMPVLAETTTSDKPPRKRSAPKKKLES